jgi:hypothetical protein
MRLECFLGGGTLVNYYGETLKKPRRSETAETLSCPFCKGRDDHLESGTRILDEVRGVKVRIGAANSIQPPGYHIGGRRLEMFGDAPLNLSVISAPITLDQDLPVMLRDVISRGIIGKLDLSTCGAGHIWPTRSPHF